MSALGDRYRRLLQLYPPDYRRERGEEMVGTYLDMVENGRRWPRVADVADLVAGSVRQRVRAAGPAFAGGLHAAALLALTAAAVLATIWLFFVELTGVPEFVELSGEPHLGPFRGLGGLVWLAWLVAAVASAVSPGPRYRWALAGALAATVAVVPASALTAYGRPALMVLLPQFALGVLALALGSRATGVTRSIPVAAAAVTTVVLQLFCLPHSPLPAGFRVSYGYRFEAEHVMPAAGLLLAAAALVTVPFLRPRRLWTLALLVTPMALCFVEPAARRISGKPSWNPADFHDLAFAATGLTVIAVAVTFGLRTIARRANTSLR